MKRSFREEPQALARAVALVADKTNIPRSQVEKDFWVTEILRAAARHEASQSMSIVFKGGTSLSKAHRLIRRFSEDVDLLVVTMGETKGSIDRFIKGTVSAVDAAIGIVGTVDTGSATKGVKRAVSYDYPSQQHYSSLRKGLLLELGTRGGAIPTEAMSIKSLIAEHGPLIGIPDFKEADEFKMRVLDPVRTLVEKLMILHHAAIAGDEAEQTRHARHYYDVWCLLNDETTLQALTRLGCETLSHEVALHTSFANLETSPRPVGGFSESPAFAASSQKASSAEVTRRAFEDVVLGDLLWPDAYKPTFDECCEAVVRNAAVL